MSKSINWRVRIKHPAFIVGVLGAVASPILAYYGAAPADLTTWSGLWGMIVNTVSNPFLLGSVVMAVLNFLGVLTDHTTAGLSDSAQALTYQAPKKS